MRVLVIFLLAMMQFGFLFAQSIDFVAADVCLGDTCTLTALTNLPQNQIKSYFWDLNNDGYYDDATSVYAKHRFESAGEHYVSLLITTLDGKDYRMENPKKVMVNSFPQGTIVHDQNCSRQVTHFNFVPTGTPTTISEYAWDFDADGKTESKLAMPEFVYNEQGNQNVSLIVRSDKNCWQKITRDFIVYTAPKPDFTTSMVCYKDNTLFINKKSNINDNSTFYWHFGDNEQSIANDTAKHQYKQAGQYEVTLSVITANNCRDRITKQVVIHQLPVISLVYSGDTLFSEGEFVTISSETVFAQYLWSNGETGNSITVNSSDTYALRVTDNNGCQATKSTNILVKNSLVVLNNVITPNNDGQNDYLTIEDYQAFKNLNLKVYSRTGIEVFHSSNYQNDWDGVYDGKPLDAGTYFYVLKHGDKQIKGSINILR